MSSGCPATCAPFSVPSAFLDAQQTDAAMRSPCCDWGQSIYTSAFSAFGPPAIPVIGFLSSFTTNPRFVAAFRQGLGEAGYIEGENVVVECQWVVGGQYDRLPTVAADLVGRQVAVIVASPIPAARGPVTRLLFFFR